MEKIKKEGKKKGEINKEQNKPCYHAPSVLDWLCWLPLLLTCTLCSCLSLLLIESVPTVLAHIDIVICSSKEQQYTEDYLYACHWEKHLIWGRTYFPILHSLRIECFKLSNFDWISSSGVQINGLKEAHFSGSAENVNRGDFFQGQKCVAKSMASGIAATLFLGGLFVILMPTFFGQQSLSGAEERRNKCPGEGVVLFCFCVFIQHNPLKLQHITN